MEFEGLSIEVSDEVYEPSDDSLLAAELVKEYLSQRKDKEIDVLDVGTGTGVLGLVCAKSGKAKSVTFADIRSEAIALARANFARNMEHVKGCACRFVVSDLFQNLEGSYDLVIFNAPYLRHEESDERHPEASRAWDGGEEGIELSIRFLEELGGHLKRGGRAVLVASTASEYDKLLDAIESLGYSVEATKKARFFFEEIVAMLIE
ncbi:MAG: HemK2/MTQ2 family protein methyltransferase [Candidatus Micrarchaeia archaeon]